MRLRPARVQAPVSAWPRAIALACTAGPALALAQAGAGSLDCMIQPHQVVQVGTASAGVIQSVRVERGDFVRRGQALVQMNAQVERAALAVAQEKASQVGELQATRGARELAAREAQRAEQLLQEQFVSRTFYEKQRAEAQVAAGRGEQASERIRLAQREVELASAQLAQRTIVSPIDGVVVERFVAPGEYVEQKPVLRIAAIDPLRVDVLVPAASFGRVEVGARATVVPELLARSEHVARVTGVDRVVDAASNTFRVRLELPNPGGKLPPGLRCKADLGIGSVDAKAAQIAPAALPRPTSAPAAPAPTVAPAAPARTLATQADVRRVEPVLPAAPRGVSVDTGRRGLAAAPASAAAPHAEVARAPAKARDVTALIAATPAPPRLRLAPFEWPTTLASVSPRR